MKGNASEELSQNNETDFMHNIDIGLITNDKRLSVSIPSYDNHYRLYFENPDGFIQNQEMKPNQRNFNKINDEKT